MDVKDRTMHPQAFDFDALYTKSITEILESIKGLSPAQYGVLIIDSITHVWEAARNAYSGKLTGAGTIPFHAWGRIKKPYKDLINLLLSSPMHVIFCGRQGNEFEEDEESGELKRIGVKMKAEGETPYEPHILIRMEAIKKPKEKQAIITAFAEKDRTGVLSGKLITWPNFDNMIKPLLPYIKADHQAQMPDQDEVGNQDAEVLQAQENQKIKESERLLGEFKARMTLCKTYADLQAIGKELTPETKKGMMSADVAALREVYLDMEEKLKPLASADVADKTRKPRSDKGQPRKQETPEPAPEAAGDTNENEPVQSPSPGENGKPSGPGYLVDSEGVADMESFCAQLGLNPDAVAKRFGADKLSLLTKDEAGIATGWLLDQLTAKES
jgi:hypothetical protein